MNVFLALSCSLNSGRKVMKRLSMEPPERISSLQALWESQSGSEPGPCGNFPSCIVPGTWHGHLFVFYLLLSRNDMRFM